MVQVWHLAGCFASIHLAGPFAARFSLSIFSAARRLAVETAPYKSLDDRVGFVRRGAGAGVGAGAPFQTW